MSMLADKKRKQKWSLNPRGKVWSQDSNKFGQKLLEKMGWSQGKGLGMKEDGRIEHIKVAYKNDSQGMGYKESDDQWTEHESNFAALLEALGGGNPKSPEIQLSSLEAKSENSKARVHYRKFTRGKDLSKYSEKDLANIFGKKSLKEVKHAKHEPKAVDQGINDHMKEDKNFSNAGLISEYFKKKLPNFGITNGYMVGNNGVLKKVDHSESEIKENPSSEYKLSPVINKERESLGKLHESESESEMRPSFGFGFKQERTSTENIFSESIVKTETNDSKIKSSFVSYICQDNIAKDISSKKKKSKKKRILDDEPANSEDTPSKKKKLDVVAQREESSKEKKKDKLKNKAIDDTGLSNPAFDLLYSPTKMEKHELERIKESISEEFNDTSNTIGQVAKNFEVQVQIFNDVTPVSKKKKKKKDDAPFNIEDTPSKKKKLDVVAQTEENFKKKKKNKLKNKTVDDTGLSNPAFDPYYSPAKIEKRKLEPIEESINEQFNDTSDTIGQVAENFEVQVQIVNDVTPVSKKKKKRKDDALPNLEVTPSTKKKLDVVAQTEENSKKKKRDKLKKKVVDDTGLSNPAFDPLYSPVKIEKHKLEPIEESIIELFNDTSDTIAQVAENFEVQVETVNEVTPVSKKKKTRKDKATDMDVSSEGEEKRLNSNRCLPIQEYCETQSKRKKKSNWAEYGIEEMDISSLNRTIGSRLDNISSDISIKQRKKHKSKESQEGIDNPLFNISVENDDSFAEADNSIVPKVKEKSKKRNKNKENFCVENPVFNGEDSTNFQDIKNEEYEVKRKGNSNIKDKRDKDDNRGLDNPALNLNDTIEESFDLMLNVVATPVQNIQERSITESSVNIKKVKGVTRRKSVRFSDVTRERIIPTKEEIGNETLDDSRDILEIQGTLNDSSELTYIDRFIEKKKAKKQNKGLDNIAFDEQFNNMEENIKSITKTLDTFQAEIENDINEAKQKTVEIEDIMVGEIGDSEGTNEKLSDGTVKLKFKHANFKKTAKYIEALTGPKKSYKHLIKGDIVMGFKETNLHEIQGYAIAGETQ